MPIQKQNRCKIFRQKVRSLIHHGVTCGRKHCPGRYTSCQAYKHWLFHWLQQRRVLLGLTEKWENFRIHLLNLKLNSVEMKIKTISRTTNHSYITKWTMSYVGTKKWKIENPLSIYIWMMERQFVRSTSANHR